MRPLPAVVTKVLGAALLLLVAPLGWGAVFTLGPGSNLTLSGTLSVDIDAGIATFSGSAPLEQQGPGGLTAGLTGSLNATVGPGTITFPGGSSMQAVETGPWQPSGLPGAFGFKADIALSGPIPGATLKILGDIRNLSLDLSGAAALSGAAPNQSFDMTGLSFTSVTGIASGQAQICLPACEPSESFTFDFGGTTDILPGGAGSLTQSGPDYLLVLPILLTADDTQSTTDDGVTVTLTTMLTLEGDIQATAPIPEPSTWLLLLAGLAIVGSVRRARIASSNPATNSA